MPWIRIHGRRMDAWAESAALRRLYLTCEYLRLLPKVQGWKREYRGEEEPKLARWLKKRDPLPYYLAPYGYRSFARQLLTREPSETLILGLARRHGYRPSTVKRYITLTLRTADAAVAAARSTESTSTRK